MKTKMRLKTILAACALLLGALCAASAGAPAQPPPPPPPQIQDLGGGLSYLRVTHPARQLPDIRAALKKHPALVLDLRGAAGNYAAARALRAALAPAPAPAPAPAKPAARGARLVLINAATAPAISFALGGGIAGNGIPGVLVLAPATAGVPADVKAPGSADDDRRACEAIAEGAPLQTLINHQPDKPRNDEAALMREQNGEAPPDAPAADASPASSAPASAPPPAPPPLTDSVLQLAVQTHRALVALKKL